MQNTLKKVTSGRRWLWIAGGVIVIGIAVFAYNEISRANRRANAQTRVETAQVQTGNIAGTITASGHLQAHQTLNLSMQASGVVKEVDVKVGDKVKAGQILLKLDDADTQRNLQAAQNALEEARLSAQSAQVTYNSDAGYKPNQSSLASAIANANNAAAAVQAAQADYDRVQWNPAVSATSQSLALAQASNNYTAAKASLDNILNTRPDLSNPKINLDLANLKVDDAQIALDTAQATLNKMTLVAPFDGTVTAVNFSAGETPSGAAVSMISADNLEALMLVGETDMASLAVGDQATFTLSTWPNQPITGKVIAIDPVPTVGSNADVVNYGVHISVDKTDLPILVGMTANATVTTFNLTGVMLVPNGAVTLDTNGKYYVNAMSNGRPNRTEVTIGVHNTQFTQILSGLQPGDEIAVNALAVTTTGGARPGGFLFGGGGGGGGPRQGGPGGN